MGVVDEMDDSITRYVVRHYRFDPDRHELRAVVVGVYDTEREWRAHLDRVTADIARRRASGERVDRREHSTGGILRPGDRERAATVHLVRRAVEHGVNPTGLLRGRELSSSMVVFGPQDAVDSLWFRSSS